MTGSVVQVYIPKMLEVSSINRFEVYGDPGPEAAHMLAKVGLKFSISGTESAVDLGKYFQRQGGRHARICPCSAR
jgi:hypothetical protein